MEKLKPKFDLIIEATGSASLALKSIEMMDADAVLCLLGIYREAQICNDVGRVFTELVLNNRLIFGSVNANKKYFEMGVSHLSEIKKKYGNITNRMITRFTIENFIQALEGGGIKRVIVFEAV